MVDQLVDHLLRLLMPLGFARAQIANGLANELENAVIKADHLPALRRHLFTHYHHEYGSQGPYFCLVVTGGMASLRSARRQKRRNLRAVRRADNGRDQRTLGERFVVA